MRKQIIFSILLLTAIAMLCSYFFYFLYFPERQNLSSLEKEINKLECDIKQYEMNIEGLKSEIAKMPLGKINLNYFNRQKIDDEEQVPYFLQLINRMTNNLAIKLLSVSPRSSKNKGDYIKNSFEIKLEGDYSKLMRFIWQIEYDLKLNLDSATLSYLRYSDDYNKLNLIEAGLKINSLEMQNQEERECSSLFELREQYISSSKEEMIIERSKKKIRDPFLEPSEAKHARQQQDIIDETLKELTVVGIMDFKNQKRALINNKFVKEGDLLMDQIRVLKINNDAVILGLNNKEYRLHIIENPVSFKQNSRRIINE